MQTSIDPVCAMTVGPGSPHESVRQGIRRRFCSTECKTRFDADRGHINSEDARYGQILGPRGEG